MNPDPTFHRDREKQFIEHARELLRDDRLRLQTTRGRLPVDAAFPVVKEGEPGVERGEKIKRQMLELGVSDRSLQSKMPVGERVEVTLRQRNFWMLKKPVGSLLIATVSPTRALLKGEPTGPASAAEVNAILGQLKPSAGGVPTTVALMSTSGFSPEARGLASDTSNRTLLLVEPNEAGGWTATGPAGAAALVDLFDPEAEESKRQRVRDYLGRKRFELISDGVFSSKIAAETQLPLPLVEAELRDHAREAGLVVRKIDDQLVVLRGESGAADSGGSDMPFWEKLKGLFKRKESADQKMAAVGTMRAGVSRDRDKEDEEIALISQKEKELQEQFATATQFTKQRIAKEMLRLHRDIQQRERVRDALDKKLNVLDAAAANVKLGKVVDDKEISKLEKISESAEEIDERLAALDQLDEVARSSVSGPSEVSDEVQAMMAELESLTAGKQKDTAAPAKTAQRDAAGPVTDRPVATQAPAEPRRTTPEAG